MKKQYYAVVAASQQFQPGLAAFINSFRIHHEGMNILIKVCDYNLDEEFKRKYDGTDIEWVDIYKKKSRPTSTKIHRLKVAIDLDDGVVGHFDADMFICSSMLNMWRLAEAGFIIGGANGANLFFKSNFHPPFNMPVTKGRNFKTISATPTFMDIERHGIIWKSVYDAHLKKDVGGSDWVMVNIFLSNLDKLTDVIPFPGEVMSGVNHLQLIPGTRILSQSGRLITTNGLVVKCIHGRYWESDWCVKQVRSMARYLGRRGIVDKRNKVLQGVLGSYNLIQEYFKKYCDWPYEFELETSMEELMIEGVKLH